MDSRISLTISQLLVPLLIAFIAGMIGGVSLLAGSRTNTEPAVVVEKNSGNGLGWAVLLVFALVFVIAVFGSAAH